MQDEFKKNSNKSKLREVILFLTICFVSLSFPALFFCPKLCPFTTMAFITIFRNIGLSALVFWFLKVRGEPLCRIGWTAQDLSKHILWAVVFFLPFYFSVGLVLDFFTRLGLSHIEEVPPSLMPEGIGELLLGGLLVLVVAFAEEIIFRGYLLSRITEISEDTRIGVFLYTLVFGLGHAYEGTAGMLAVAYIGLVFSLLILWKKSLAVVIVLHFLINFIPLVLTPALEMRW